MQPISYKRHRFPPEVIRQAFGEPTPSPCWRLDEMMVRIGGRRIYLRRAVDDGGVVLDMLIQRRRNTAAAL